MSTKKAKTQVKSSKRELNRNANRKAAKQRKQELADVDGVTYLKEGVTGTMRRQALLDTNKAIKVERATYKRAFDDIFANEQGFISQLSISKTQFKKQITPRMVKNQFTTYQLALACNAVQDEKRGYVNYSPYFMMQAMEKALKGANENPLAVRFFDSLESGDERKLKLTITAINKAYNKAKAEKEAKKAK